MPSYDERTQRGWPLPFRSNSLEVDVERLRETFNAIDEALSILEENTHTLLDERVAGLEEKQFILDDRMDVIAGQVTEDTEILDARVDAESETHPNLGHNIRNLHSLILSLKDYADNLRDSISELNDDLSAAKEKHDNDYAVNSEAILRETENRTAKDDELHAENEELREALTAEISEREILDTEQHEQTQLLLDVQNRLSENVIEAAISTHDKFRLQSEKLDAEIAERERVDSELNDSITGNAEAILRETENRTAKDDELHAENEELKEEINSLNDELLKQKDELRLESREREISDVEHQGQTEILHRGQNDLSEAFIQTAISSHEKFQSLNERLNTETEKRSTEDTAIHEELSEHETRLGVLEDTSSDIQAEITAEENIRLDSDETLNEEVNHLGEGLITEMISRVEDNRRIRSGIEEEKAQRESEDTRIHEELDNSEYQRKEADNEILRGLDKLSEAVIQNAATLKHEGEQRRRLEDVVAGIKSPVDWSKSSSVQIPEPRCAIVNISGITSMPTSKTTELSATMEFWDMQGNFFRKNISCAAQGDSSMAYPKKNVKFDLLNEDGSEFEIKIGSWPVQDGFHLKAYYTDFFRGVGAVSYKVWDEIMRFNGILSDRPYKKVLLDMSKINTSGTELNNPDDLTLQTDTGALCHPDGFPCIVYLNGTFYGIFSWQIKKHRANYHLTKSTVEHIHLDGSLYTGNFWDGNINWAAFEIRNPNKLYTMNGSKYDGDAPKELIDETSEKYDPENKDHVRSAQVKAYIKGLVSRFGEFKQNPTQKKYEEIFDWENQRDYLIFSDVIKNSDGFSKNWQWFTYDGVKWFVGAYDLDMSYGGMFNGTSITAPLTGHINTSTALPTGYITRLYNAELEERYRELRDAGIINAEHIARMLEDWMRRISTENYELEYERWPNSPCIKNYTDSLYRVRLWLDKEIAIMDKAYHYVPYETRLQTQLQSETSEREREDERIEEHINAYAQMESSERQSVDGIFQEQLTQIGELSIRLMLELREMQQAFKEWVNVVNVIYQTAADTGNLTYMGAGVASGNEITSMLSDVLSGNDTGEVTESEIPEELKDQITTSEEVDEMLSEVFSNN